MRLEYIEAIDFLIVTTLIIGLWFEIKKIIKYGCFNEDTSKMLIIKYFFCSFFIYSSFILEYAIIKNETPINNNVFLYFIVNRGFGLAFIITAVLHSLGLTLWRRK